MAKLSQDATPNEAVSPKNSIKCVITDIDGTLANSKHVISLKNALAFFSVQNAGIPIFPATGRSRAGFYKILDDKTKEVLHYAGYPGIFHNGAMVVGPEGPDDIIFEKVISLKIVLELVEFLSSIKVAVRKNDIDQKFVESGKRALSFGVYKGDLGYIVDQCVSYICYEMTNVCCEGFERVPCLSKHLEIYKIEPQKVCILEDKEVLKEIYPLLEIKAKELGLRIVFSCDTCIDFLPFGISKGEAAKILLDKLGVSAESTMAIGDADNDLEILAYVRHSVAMGNASPQVKRTAHYHVASNDEDGFAQAIETICGVQAC